VTVSEGSTEARRKILIVEDEPLIAWSLADMVRELGHVVAGTVATERAAVEEAARLAPDLVMMDFRLAGGGSGLSAAKRIRQTRADLPILFCTAYAEEAGLRTEMLAIPRSTVLGKPVFRANLQRALAQLLPT
jgi:CheY-like chemotaxis protein